MTPQQQAVQGMSDFLQANIEDFAEPNPKRLAKLIHEHGAEKIKAVVRELQNGRSSPLNGRGINYLQAILQDRKWTPEPAAEVEPGEIPMNERLSMHMPLVRAILDEVWTDPDEDWHAWQKFCERATFISGPEAERWNRWKQVCSEYGVDPRGNTMAGTE